MRCSGFLQLGQFLELKSSNGGGLIGGRGKAGGLRDVLVLPVRRPSRQTHVDNEKQKTGMLALEDR